MQVEAELYNIKASPAEWSETMERKFARHLRYRTAQTNLVAKARKAVEDYRKARLNEQASEQKQTIAQEKTEDLQRETQTRTPLGRTDGRMPRPRRQAGLSTKRSSSRSNVNPNFQKNKKATPPGTTPPKERLFAAQGLTANLQAAIELNMALSLHPSNHFSATARPKKNNFVP